MVLNLYPDLPVCIRQIGGTARVGADGIHYAMSEKEAQTVEKTLPRVVLVIDMIIKAGFTLRQMQERDANLIGSWESEKYRAKLVK